MSEFQTFLRKKGYEINQHSSGPEVQKISGVVIDATGWGTYLVTKNNFIRLISKCPVRVSAVDLSSINNLLLKINFGVVVGCFEIDFSDGEIQLRSSIPTKTSLSSISSPNKLLEPMFGRHISVLAKHGASIVRAVVNPPAAAKVAEDNKEEDSDAKAAAMLYKMLKQLLLGGDKTSAEAMNMTQPVPKQEETKEKKQGQSNNNKEEGEKEKKEENKTTSPEQNRRVNEFSPDLIIYRKDNNGKKVKIGRGAFATVYEAKLHGSKVAVKVIKEDMPIDVVELLEREVAVMNALQHPNIVLMLGMCKSPPSLIMPLMEKGSLQNFISKQISIPFKLKVKYLVDCARGMAYVHGNKILHGDLKPLNILVDQNDVAHVADFGLSRIKATTASLRAGTVLQGFTPVFAAPEQLSSGTMSIATDVYAFGITMWALATYKTPFISKFTTINELKILLEKGNRPEMTAYTNDVATDYKVLAAECWHGDPSTRPDFITILGRLEKILDEF